jgi:hypothetical protein
MKGRRRCWIRLKSEQQTEQRFTACTRPISCSSPFRILDFLEASEIARFVFLLTHDSDFKNCYKIHQTSN